MSISQRLPIAPLKDLVLVIYANQSDISGFFIYLASYD